MVEVPSVADFFARVVPWPQTGVPGFVNMHWSLVKHAHAMGGKPLSTLVDFMAYIDTAKNRSATIKDIYFCLSMQEKTGPTKNGYTTAYRNRDNVAGLKAVWLDLDVKPSAYKTTLEALDALLEFCKTTGFPMPTAIVLSGSGGAHVYWISDKVMTFEEWAPYAQGLKNLGVERGLKADYGCTTDSVRVLRVPGTFNHKTTPGKPVTLEMLAPKDIDFEAELGRFRATVAPAAPRKPKDDWQSFDPAVFSKQAPDPLYPSVDTEEYRRQIGTPHGHEPLSPEPMLERCPMMADALATGGKDADQGLWMLQVLATTFCHNGREVAHKISKGHKSYTPAETDEMFNRKDRECESRGLGWPLCETFKQFGSTRCAACPHKEEIKSPLNLALPQQTSLAEASHQTPAAEPSFGDPYAEFVGRAFPLDVLPQTLFKFVDAEHRAMGADPSAIAMAALTAVAGAIHAETLIRVGEGWWERPIIWTALVGQPSTKKSPILEKVTKPLIRIDHERLKRWRQDYATWKKLPKTIQNGTPQPPRPLRCVINDATPEKVAEILSRDPSGSLMVHDELAGWLGGFDRYNSGQSARAFYLTCWNGGPFTQDRVGKGRRDADAEIHVENLALCISGGIQPDRLAKLSDLTSDGLLQRFVPVLMQCAERGDEYHRVAEAESGYEKLIESVTQADPKKYHLADDVLEVRDRMMDYLHQLEMVDGFRPALIGAIGKLEGYFARVCLVLHVAEQHDPVRRLEVIPSPEHFSRVEGERLCNLLGVDPNDPSESLSAGLNTGTAISHRTAEAAEKVVRDFLLPNIFGLYDVVVNGGQDRDQLRSIGDFILASNKDRLRPSDITAGVRALRGQPEQKIREWVGRFCAMGWLQPEEARSGEAPKSGVPPKAWLVMSGLREHFAERRKLAEAAREKAHEILKAGGSRRSA